MGLGVFVFSEEFLSSVDVLDVTDNARFFVGGKGVN